MKTKLIFSTETKDTEFWTHISFVPHMHEWLNVQDILKTDELDVVKQSTKCWSGVLGSIESVEYKHDDNEYYVEVLIWYED